MIYKCKNCGGNVVYSPEREKMHCPHCDGIDSEDIYRGGSVSQCVNCGAPIEIGDSVSASKCNHCGSYLLFEERLENEWEPHLILPFKIGKDKIKELLVSEFGKRPFIPASFFAQASLDSIEGMYVPFFLYDYQANYYYEGRGTKIHTYQTGDIEYTETSHYRIVRDMEVMFDKIPVDASVAMDNGTMDLLEPYDYKALEDFKAKYMSGFFGERYNENLEHLEKRAEDKVRKDTKGLMSASITSYATVTPKTEQLDTVKLSDKYALMPVWVYHFRYKGKISSFYINGQNGKIIGSTPISFGKVFSYGTTIFASCMIIASLIIKILEVL